jgi:hypothetical protein
MAVFYGRAAHECNQQAGQQSCFLMRSAVFSLRANSFAASHLFARGNLDRVFELRWVRTRGSRNGGWRWRDAQEATQYEDDASDARQHGGGMLADEHHDGEGGESSFHLRKR